MRARAATPCRSGLWQQRLRDDHHVPVSKSTVRRYIATTFTEQRLEGKVTVPHGAVEAGSDAQIDYGKLGLWLEPASGRRVAVWAFAMILSCSRMMLVHPVLLMDQTSWNALHVAALEFFGGVPARLVTAIPTGCATPTPSREDAPNQPCRTTPHLPEWGLSGPNTGTFTWPLTRVTA